MKNKIILGIILCVLIALTFLVRYQHPDWSMKLMQEGQSYEYALGIYEDKLWGPLRSVLLAGILLMACIAFSFKLRPWSFFWIIFLSLFCLRPEVLFFPPYGDSIIGPFSDAIYLLRNNFNYSDYFQAESFTLGGPQVYPTSIFPSFLALLMKIAPSPMGFLILIHTIVFLMASAVIIIFRQILIKIFDEKSSTLAAVLLFCLPLFQSMSELINMEMACLLFLMATIYFLSEKRFALASLMAIGALLIKAPGAVAGLTVFAMSVIYFYLFKEDQRRLINVVWGIVPLVVTFILEFFRQKFMGEQVIQNKLNPLIGFSVVGTTGALSVFLVALILFMGFVIIKKISIDRDKRFLILTSIVVCVSWFLIYLNFSIMLPRYQLLLTPFLLFILVYVGSLYIRQPRIFQAVLSVVIFGAALNSYGLIHPPSKDKEGCNEFERSLEYRNDLKMQMIAAKILEKDYSDFTIGGALLIAQIMNFHEIGYVKKPFQTLVYAAKGTHEGIGTFMGLDKIDISKTIWAVFPRDEINLHGRTFPFDSRDLIIKRVHWGDKEIVLFMGGFGIEVLRRASFFIYQQKQITGEL